ncbi:MAG: cache domain-containing protein [Candidatus Aminicenantes bacterium]|nr:MAG: cache domain-containing protein [Candidatus Aminicenantes bacterium]
MFKNLSFSIKIMLILGLSSIVFITGIGITTYVIFKNDLEKRAVQEMKQLNDSTHNLIETTINTAVRNYLRALAEKTQELVAHHYNLYKNGEISEEEAYNRSKKIILDPGFVRIGKTGYMSVVSGNDGVLEIHPRGEGFDASGEDFMQEAMRRKNGYIEYEWKNIDEDKPRKKAGWLCYFKPWDLIIWPTAYKDEFNFIEIEDLRKEIKRFRLGESGYIFILDLKGILVAHPFIEGQNTIDFKDKTGKYFTREMLEKKNGSITYFWKNPGEQKEREKIVFLKHLESMDWIICSGVYLDELYEPVNDLKNIIIAISIVILILIFLSSIYFGNSISKPIKKLLEGAQAIGEGKLDIQIPINSTDEIGFLASEFNSMAKKLSRAMKEVENANQAKSRFLSNMSHEIRTPLTSILGHTESLIRKVKDKKITEPLEHIKVSTKTLKDFIDNTIYMSRLEKEKLIIRIEPVNFYAILNEIRENFSFSIQQKKLEYLEEVEPGIPQYMHLDKLRLRQVLINLVDNALKYTEKGHIRLIIRKKPSMVDTNAIDLIFEVEDTGIGIARGDWKRLFKPFERLEEKREKSTEGAGLGLAISKKIIQLMGGEISVHSELNKGTTFTFLLKNVRVSSQEEVTGNGEEFDYSSITFSGQKILIVDDSKETRSIIKDHLENTTLQVFEACDGREALEMVQKHQPDLILMDIKMPTMDGIEATRELRKDEKSKDIPIVALTASKTAPEDVEKYEHLFHRYLFKPISIAKLFFELNQFLKEEPLHIEDGINMELTPGDKKKIPGILRELEGYLEIWQDATKSNNFNQFKSFGLKIKELGDKYSLPVLTDYAGQLLHHADMSSITATKRMLNAYPVLINKLKTI